MLTIVPTTSLDRSSSVENRSSREVRLMFFALLFNLQHLPGQRAICLGHLAVGIVSINALALGADLRRPDRARDFSIEDLDLAAVGGAKQSADFFGVVGAAAVIVRRMPSMRRFRLICQRTLFTVCRSCSRPFAERNCGCAGTRTLSAAARALIVSILREGIQSMRM